MYSITSAGGYVLNGPNNPARIFRFFRKFFAQKLPETLIVVNNSLELNADRVPVNGLRK